MGAVLVAWGMTWVLRASSLPQTLAGVLFAAAGVTAWVLLFPDAAGCMVFSRNPIRCGVPVQGDHSLIVRLILAILVFSSAIWAQSLMRSGKVAVSLGFYLASAAFLLVLEPRSRSFAPRPEGPGDPCAWKPVHGVPLLAIGALFLFYDLPNWPNWLHHDGAMSLKAALGFLGGHFKTPFFTEWGDNPTLPFLAYAGAFKVGGISLTSAAGVSCLATLLALPFLYGWARFFLPGGMAFFTALIFATSRWLLFFVRTPREVSFLPAFEVMALYFFTAAVETGKSRHFAWFGASLALCLNTYLPSRILPVFFLAALILMLLAKPRGIGAQWKHWILSAGVFLIAFLPMILWYKGHPNALVNRIREIGIIPGLNEKGSWSAVVDSFRQALLMFDVRGVGDPHFNIETLPYLAGAVGLCLWVGLAWCFLRVLKTGSPGECVLLAGFSLSLLTTTFALPPAHPMRAIVILPFVVLLAGIGADRLVRTLASCAPRNGGLVVRTLVASWIVIASVLWNWDVYFVKMPRSAELWGWCEGAHLLAAKTLAGVPRDRVLYAPTGYAGYNHEVVLNHGREIAELKDERSIPADLHVDRGAAWLVEKDQDTLWGPWIRKMHPLSSRKEIRDPFGNAVFCLYGMPGLDVPNRGDHE